MQDAFRSTCQIYWQVDACQCDAGTCVWLSVEPQEYLYLYTTALLMWWYWIVQNPVLRLLYSAKNLRLPLFPCPNIIFIYSFPHRYIVLFLLLILMFSQCVSFVCLVCSAGLVGSALADDESVVTYILDWLKGRNLNVSCYEKAFAKCI